MRNSLIQIIRRFVIRLRIEAIVAVADAGMLSEQNLTALDRAGTRNQHSPRQHMSRSRALRVRVSISSMPHPVVL
jgi:hypothetical protein